MSAPPYPSAPAFLTIPEACRELHIARATLYELLRDGRLRSVKLGSARRIPRQELDRIAALAAPLTALVEADR